MVRHLGLALYAEGPTDERFLGPLLRRLCADICARSSRHLVEFNDDMLLLQHASAMRTAPRQERILQAAQQARGAWSLLFVHADADGDQPGARRERTEPALAALQREFSAHGRGVAVVPVQQTEAWAICDGDALRRVFGTALDDRALGLPVGARAIERLADPKQCLKQAFAASRSGMRRRQVRSVSETLGPLGEQVSLDRLRALQAIRALEAELERALVDLHVLDGR